jgi:CheY-like chemotaxis protein
MAGNLLDEKQGSGVVHLNLFRGVQCAVDESIIAGMPSTRGVGETFIIGESMIAETMIGAAMLCAPFVEAQPKGGTETILLAEDEGFVRKATTEVLQAAGYKLMTARTGAEAMDACRQLSEPIDLLLADIVMPGMSGRDLASEFEILSPHARVLLMSGYAGQLSRCHMSPHGRNCVAKPFSVHTLLRKVREVLDTNPFDGAARA